MKKHKNTNGFVTFWIIIFAIGFLVISGRFLYIQLTGNVQNVSLIDWAENVRKTSATIESERGTILDASGNLLAFNRPVYKIYAILDEEFTGNSSSPLHVVDIDETAEKLSDILALEKKDIASILEKGKESSAFQVEFGKEGKDLSEKEKERIMELDLPGINFMKESKRYYPNNHFASHIIGFVNENEEESEVQGVTGIESIFNKYLLGEDGYINYQRDSYNKKLLQKEAEVKEPEDGYDIYLTIDQKIQSLLEDTLDKAVEQYEPERITTIVMNAKNGEVLALANRPSVNPNDIDEVQNWYNDAISTPVEPGSTMKIFTWAAAIDAGVYDPKETFLSGKYKIHEQVQAVNDHNSGAGWGDITYDEGFYRSSNVAASKLVWEKMEENVYLDYLDKFGLFQKTNIELPNEMVGELSFNYPSDKIRTAFGQSSTLTPLAQVKAATAFANGGEMVQPTIVKKIVDPTTGETMQQAERTVVGQPISEDTTEKMLDLMDGVVNSDKGTGKPFKLENYTVIGKTGTAQMPNLDGGGYEDGGLMYSFLGMAPKDDPELIVFTSVLKPELKDTEAGSDVVSYIFKNIMENSLHYLHVEPDNDDLQQATKITMSKIIGESKKNAEKLLADFSDVVVVGKGKEVKDINIKENATIYDSQKIIILLDDPVMPDITGWSARDVNHLGNLLDIPIEINGEGFVTKQSIKSKSKIKDDDILTVELSANPKGKKKKKKDAADSSN